MGDVVFTVNDISTTNEIIDAGGYISYKPESEGSKFIVISVTVENAGKESITTDSEFFMFDGINPGLSQKGNILFERPVGAKELNLSVQTRFWGSETGRIDLK